jgi:hypothetical protein
VCAGLAGADPTGLAPDRVPSGRVDFLAHPVARCPRTRTRATLNESGTDQSDRREPALRDGEAASSYALGMSGSVRVERGWIYIDGTRQDDGTIKLGTGGEMRFSPFEAISQRQQAQITWGHILTASVQRLAFWRR